MREKIIAHKIAMKYAQFDNSAIEQLAQIIERKQVDKHKLLLKDRETLEHLYYVDKGLLRMFYIRNGHDITVDFLSENCISLSLIGFLYKESGGLMVEAIESSAVYAIPYMSLVDLLDHSLELSTLYRLIVEDAFQNNYKRWDAFQFASAKERYERFMHNFPSLVNRVPLLHIASYLVMSPETLSRVRGSMFRKK